MKILRECWELLKNELNKKDIYITDIFMKYIFFDLFTELNKSVSITDYQSLINLKKNLDEIILKKINNFKTDYKSIDKLKNLIKMINFFPSTHQKKNIKIMMIRNIYFILIFIFQTIYLKIIY